MLMLVSALFVVAALLVGCTYHMHFSETADRVWLIQREPSVGGPTVYECCDACGTGGGPRCWEATINSVGYVSPPPRVAPPPPPPPDWNK